MTITLQPAVTISEVKIAAVTDNEKLKRLEVSLIGASKPFVISGAKYDQLGAWTCHADIKKFIEDNYAS